MRCKTNALKNSEPIYYHREYKNDISDQPPQEHQENSWLTQSKRVGFAALPFLSLYKPFSFPLSLGMGGLRLVTSCTQLISNMQAGNSENIPFAMLQTTVSAAALAGTVFAHPLGMLISTANDLSIEVSQLVQNLQDGEHKKAMESCLNIVNNSLYLALFLDGGLGVSIASLSTQVLIGLYHSHTEFSKGRYIEGTSHLLMSMIRGNQLAAQIENFQTKWRIEDSLKKVKELEPKKNIFSASIEDVNLLKTENPELAEIFIKYGNNPKGIPALHYAVDQRDEKAVELLLQHGISPNTIAFGPIDADDWDIQMNTPLTPLDYAAQNGDVGMLNLLLKHGAHINSDLPPGSNIHGQWSPALNFAATHDKGDAVHFLLSKGAAICGPDSTQESMYSHPSWEELHPAYIATEHGSVKALEALARSGIDLKGSFGDSGSLLHVAANAGTLKSIRFLISHGVDINRAQPQTRNTALHIAAIRKNIYVAEELLENKADVNATNRWGLNPLQYTIPGEWYIGEEKNLLAMTRLLVHYGVDLSKKDDEGHTVLHKLVFETYSEGYNDIEDDREIEELVLCLLENGADINSRDQKNHTVLYSLRQELDQGKGRKKRQNIESTIQWLIEHGATE